MKHKARLCASAAALSLGMALGVPNVQQAGAQQPAAKPAPIWVKVCEAVTVNEPDPKDAKKPIQTKRSICHTHHERLDASSGTVMVSVAIREVEGVEKKAFMLMLPLGMAIQPGVQIGLYPPDMWAAIQKGAEVDISKMEALKLGYTLCLPSGCSAELDATPELLKKLQGSGGLIAFAVNAGGAPTAFPAPLTGFSEALTGPPVDKAVYDKDRQKFLDQLNQNRKAMADEFRKQNQDLQSIAPKPRPDSAAAPAAPVPATTAPAAKKP